MEVVRGELNKAGIVEVKTDAEAEPNISIVLELVGVGDGEVVGLEISWSSPAR